jgi:signal recognition particle GTPase
MPVKKSVDIVQAALREARNRFMDVLIIDGLWSFGDRY